MKRFGLIGHPIEHSLSPALFKAGYDGQYPYNLIEGEDFESSYRRFIEGYDGINVTAPFKEKAFAKADILSEECRLIKATNLLVKTSEGIKAYNSDYLGVRLWLQEVLEGCQPGGYPSGTSPASPAARGTASLADDHKTGPFSAERTAYSVLIAGCGGAGKAAAIAAASLGLRVILMNRDMAKAESIAESIASIPGTLQAEVRPLDEFRSSFRECDIIIYNIPTAIPTLYELSEEDLCGARDKGNGQRTKHILEANYKNPSFDKALIDRMMQTNPNITYTEGQTWLLYQALTGYEIFTGQTPDFARMSAVI